VRGYFITTREIVRYCNQVRGPMALLAGEVEAADILALECLRMFEPQAWSLLGASAEALTSQTGARAASA
jgi:hypothetical protein